MIQIIQKEGAVPPVVLQNKGVAETKKLIKKAASGKLDFNFDSSIYGHADVKARLIDLQNNKCCFCESKIGHISYGDVEHFRPKAGWVQNNEPLNTPGYYWLAYDWDNLLLCCQKCNQRFKRNYFPLKNNQQRASSNLSDLAAEQPVFIHPVNEDPARFISFTDEIPIGIDDEGRGSKTIELLGLDRELLNEQRRNKLNMIRDFCDLADGFPETLPELKKEAKETVLKYINESKSDKTEYAAMLRCFFNSREINQ